MTIDKKKQNSVFIGKGKYYLKVNVNEKPIIVKQVKTNKMGKIKLINVDNSNQKKLKINVILRYWSNVILKLIVNHYYKK